MLILTDNGEYAIEDMGSRSGTSVNDQTITERRVLKVGDRIGIGQSSIEFSDKTSPEAEPSWDQLGSD